MKREKMLELMELFSPVDVSIIKYTDLGVNENDFTNLILGVRTCALCEIDRQNCDKCCIRCSSGSNYNNMEGAQNDDDYDKFEESRKLLLQELINFKAENPDHKLCQVGKKVEQKEMITIELEVGKEETEYIEELYKCHKTDLDSWDIENKNVKQLKMCEFLEMLGGKLTDKIKPKNEESDNIPFQIRRKI